MRGTESVGHHDMGDLVRRRLLARLMTSAGDAGVHDHRVELALHIEGGRIGDVERCDLHTVQRMQVIALRALRCCDLPAALAKLLCQAKADTARCADDEDMLAH